ncbi:DUF4142 domain-containing protein [Allorhodopirellula solitaria]|uniref:DUF4142 domain-containing protein n=1 Tax=Allorhodopirellula solitaria TaxID=2527987 RepID=A0A5C5YHG7_9BACT|nr:DUF4142 domain-containing protein [Allorhodopirellula solitaria]TWT72862.1 hypothetical protein CA85_13230 [Allorhodopirellula solitaria]
MLKLRFTTTLLSTAAIAGLSTVNAQTTLPQPIPQEVPSDQSATLPGQPTDRPVRSQTEQDGRYEARRAAQNSVQQQGPTVKEALTQKLIKANEAEIELAKLAHEKSDNEDLKQLAVTIVKDHQQFNQVLQQHAEKRQGDRRNAAASQTATVPKQLCEIGEKACDNALKMTKEMLGNYEGQDFSMAFLGQQCVAHTMMLAELRAIESSGPEELQPVAAEAANKVEKHLEEAKKLAKKLEDDRRSRS